MQNNRKAIAYNALVLIGLILLLCVVTRLWPVILLMIVGAIILCIRLLFRLIDDKAQKETTLPMPIVMHDSEPKNEQELLRIAFGIIQKRITEELLWYYPDVRWVWETPNAMRAVAEGSEEVHILLNRAGGYRRMRVLVRNLQFMGLAADTLQPVRQNDPEPEVCGTPDEDSEDASEWAVNYELLAFDWVEEHMLDLTARCSECIAMSESAYLIPESNLPEKESWEAICAEIKRHDFPDASAQGDGIRIILPQG